MAFSGGHVGSQLRHFIYYHLDNNMIRNALFLAERYHAHEPRSLEAQYLISLCHLLNGEMKSALEFSEPAAGRGLHAGCVYVYAQACLDLEKYLEGATALERSKPLWATKNNWNKHSETQRQHLPDAAAVYCLLGKLWQAHKDVNKAVDCYVNSLKLNPFMWDAFTGLCATGVNIRVPNIYDLGPDLRAMINSTPEEADTFTDVLSPTEGALRSNRSAASDPFTVPSSRADPEGTYGSSALWEKFNGSSGMETPGNPNNASGSEDFRIANSVPGPDSASEPPLAPTRKARTIHTMNIDQSGHPPPKMKTTGMRKIKQRTESEEPSAGPIDREPPPAPRVGDRKRTVSGQVAHPQQHPVEPGAPQRRSVRLLSQIKPTTSKFSSTTLTGKDGREVKKIRSTSGKPRTATVGRVVSGNRKPIESSDPDGKEPRAASVPINSGVPPVPKASERTKELVALDALLGLFAKLASGYFSLNRYKCPEAISHLNSLPQEHRETPWVLAQLGRAYFEQAMYTEAAKYFSRIQALAPNRLQDMEIYSTVLWHLKNDVELAHLAHHLLEVDRLSPQAWCALGNSFSHERDHDQAIKCFKRATMLDPEFAYAFTLQGHEYVSNEEFNKALDSYRQGINVDNRHYNAWYGLGTVYDKIGKYEYAEHHFRNAASINPTNAVLICCIGLVLEKTDDFRGALVHYERACSLAPHSVLARFRKARVLMKCQEYNFALADLKILKDIAPNEANVHFLLGKLYKMLHDKPNAIKHFTAALNLDPKAAHFIKDAMDEWEDDDMEDDDMA
ncbi:anaphase-promoting complex subunit cdc27 [Penicillium argentinense]|uniref:Anaphase-promoting complex subunit cdc27 n=1 Tax=Penicillium argentinense TaxID=1131581 RepID=A0A9W9FMU5_9EURO|nr:anaphase-promoting complex subunit cdc27 [Penicillium argentinense]KAJ5103069.1 anaphase-promoting complex subunit cdc27 [Penicillium argentinense]